MKRALTLLLLTACSGGTAGFSPNTANAGGVLPLALSDARASKIQHFVILVQENRTYDNLFATFPGGDGAKTGVTHAGKAIALKETNLSDYGYPHDHRDFLTEYDRGKMDGFDLVGSGGAGQFKAPPQTGAYQYVFPNQIAPYWAMAKQYVLADHMFQTQSSGSYTAHLDLIAGGTEFSPGHSIIDFPTGSPWGCDAPSSSVTSLITLAHWVPGTARNYQPGKGPAPCVDFPTIRDSLDAAHVTWKYYVPAIGADASGALFNAFDSVRAVRYGPEWTTNVSSPEKNIFTDISNGTLPSVSWVIPDFLNSDHAVDPPNPVPAGYTFPIDYGPAWVASVVNAIGKSKYWNNTAIVVTWDDWGGYYDHVAPPQIDYQGTGFRVPLLVISPYVPKGKISHTTYEFGSILKCVEQTFKLAPLNQWDRDPNSICAGPGNVFNFARPARTFVPISTKFTKQFFTRQPPSNEPVDTE